MQPNGVNQEIVNIVPNWLNEKSDDGKHYHVDREKEKKHNPRLGIIGFFKGILHDIYSRKK